MRSARNAEHIGAVADGGDHLAVRRGELGAERLAEAEAERARRAADERAGLFEIEEGKGRAQFLDDDGIRGFDLIERMRDPGRMDRLHRRRLGEKGGALLVDPAAHVGDLAPALIDARLPVAQFRHERIAQQDDRRAGITGDGEIHFETAERIVGVQRIMGDVNELGLARSAGWRSASTAPARR